MRHFILFILSITLFAAEDAIKPNPIVEKTLNPTMIQATKAYESYKTALDKISTQAVKDLEKAKSDAMKKGDLPTATALDNMVKDIKNGKLADMVADSIKPKEGTDLLGDAIKPNGKSMAGLWRVVKVGGVGGGIGSTKCMLQVDKDQVTFTQQPVGMSGKLAEGVITWENGGTWSLANEGGKLMLTLPGEGIFQMLK